MSFADTDEYEKLRITALNVRLSALLEVARYSIPLQHAADAVRIDPEAPVDQTLGIETYILTLIRNTVVDLNEALKPSQEEWDRELKECFRPGAWPEPHA